MGEKGSSGADVPPQQQMMEQADHPLTSTSTPTSRKLLQPCQLPSSANSPKSSRDTSPMRPAGRNIQPASTPSGRSRKNRKEISPSRSASGATTNSNPPSAAAAAAAAAQRHLSATSTPQLHAPSAPEPRAPVPLKPSELKDSPRWPLSPRLSPLISSIASPRKTEHESAPVKLHRAGSSAGTTSSESKQGEGEEESPSSGMRGQARGVSASNSTLETVQEASYPSTPAIGRCDGTSEAAAEEGILRRVREQENPMDTSYNGALRSKPPSVIADSGNESAGKGEIKMRSTTVPVPPPARPPVAPAPKSFAAATPAGRGKAVGEGSTRNMTVETETVNSVPQVAIGGGAGIINGSLRTKPSSETIRPKREKKRTTRKAPSTSGMAASKADIFEAKIASAVNEAESSDSDETFVYESNPPDVSDRPRPRFHSRTPSATSMVSQLNTRDGNRGMLDGGHSVALKKSMKFANSYSNNNNSGNNETGVDDDGKGTSRSNMGTGRGTVYHHHIGRWGRNGNGHPSLFDQESPFPNASRPSKLSGNTSRQSSRPTSPRFSHHIRGKRSPITHAYDPDETAADDERTPLIHGSSIRSGRARGQRRPVGSRYHERRPSEDGHLIFGRNSTCLIVTFMLILISFVAGGFVFATTEPLEEVKIIAMENVVASEQELMLDLVVQARNPNAIGIGVDTLDISVFAVTKHATEELDAKRSSLHRRREEDLSRVTFDDSPYDPPLDEEDPAAETIRLGSIYVFDSPLQFDGFPWAHQHSESTGAVTLANPGNDSNRTVEWERALKYEFDLVVKGVLRYTLPLSGKVRRANIKGRVTVQPAKPGKDPKDKDEKTNTDDDWGSG